MSRRLANALMLLVAVIWGTTFVAQQLGVNFVGPLTYTGTRFLIGALVVLPLAMREYRQISQQGVRIDRRDFLAWSGLGGLLFLGVILQQIGIGGTTVSNAGFLTALYVPLVPIMAWILGHGRPRPSVWIATMMSLLGTLLLSGGELDGLTAGDFWVILSTLFWAAHVLWVGRLAARKGTPIIVAATQFLVCGLLALILAPFQEQISMEGLIAALPAILYGGLLSVGIGFTLQVVAQRHANPADAAILLSSEVLFAALAGALYLGERLSVLQLSGGVLIFAAMLGVQIASMWEKRPEAISTK